MRRISQGAILAAAAVLLALPAAAQSGQSQPAPQTAAQTAKKDKNKDHKDQAQPPSVQPNPFPEAKSEKAAQQAQQGSPPSAPVPRGEPSALAPQTKGKSAAEQNPFPEAKSERAAQQAQQNQQPRQAQPEQGTDSSSSKIPGLNLSPVPGPPSGAGPDRVLSPSLGKQDVKVGTFYLQSGDYKGAYSRFLEATQVDPGDAEAVYGLAVSARSLGNRTAAIQNFQLYLSALPNGRRAKDCRKALKQMRARP